MTNSLVSRSSTAPSPVRPSRSVPVEPDEAWRLLSSVRLGRIVFTRSALPAIRPTPHLVEGADIIVRSHDWPALTPAAHSGLAHGVVVAYEADLLDHDTHLGWSVVAVGYAHLVTGSSELARYRDLLPAWAADPADRVVRIRAEEIAGFRLTA
ncbi:pyridoxamine 5'-phosphate oxidase family protein [Streptomyces sp. NBC_01216]|uniref:pyridoxamine 5'-phosphate oxidase family protein n=1 Tax=Streptomyces sp. NBC_01216 TaxID=2903778 RepID=UPI002E0FB7C6|nr:pyridoxamine 5'-phosphate oxidase family protein [Streptomyces sp. NBC_01216]